MFLSVALLTEGNDAEVSVFRRHVSLNTHLNQRLALQSVSNQVLDGDNLQLVLLGKDHQLGHTSHRAVIVHNLHQRTSRIETCQLTQVDGSLGMSTATQYAVVLCIKRVDMSWSSEGLGFRRWVGQCLYGGCSVVCRHASGASLQLIYGDGEGSTQHRGILADLPGQVQLLAAAQGDRCTEHASCIFQHEVHHLWCDLLGGTYQIAFVLAFFIVNHYDKLAFTEVVDGFTYLVQLDCLHHFVVFQVLYSLYMSRQPMYPSAFLPTPVLTAAVGCWCY